MTNLLNRAIAAYYRVGDEGDPCLAHSNVWDQETGPSPMRTRTYVTLANEQRLLAVYLVRTCGRLTRLRRWPAFLQIEVAAAADLRRTVALVRLGFRCTRNCEAFR